MTAKITLYSRKDCCLCDEMKAVVKQVATTIPVETTEIDIDSSAALQAQYGDEVPVLFIDDRKAFKFRVTVAALTKRLTRKPRPLFRRLARAIGRETT